MQGRLESSGDVTVRNIAQGHWYWASKEVIRAYTKQLGFLAIGVYHFLASMADERQRCFPSQKYVAEHLGCARASVSKAIKALVKAGLVAIERRGRYQCVYRLLAVRCQRGAPQVSTPETSDVREGDTNNNQRKRINNNIGAVSGRSSKDADNSIKPENRVELLAADLADGLHDRGHYAFYLRCAREYPESALRGLLSTVKQTPPERIKKSRSAFFRFLLRQYAE
jgi:biotin operon repressor